MHYRGLSIYIYIDTFRYIYTHIYHIYIYIYIYICIYIYIHICMNINAHTHTYIYIHTHMRSIYIYMYIHMRSTTPPPHHREGRGTLPHPHHTTGGEGAQYYGWPMTIAGGGRGLERWTIYGKIKSVPNHQPDMDMKFAVVVDCCSNCPRTLYWPRFVQNEKCFCLEWFNDSLRPLYIYIYTHTHTHIYIYNITHAYVQVCANVYACLARYRKDRSQKKSIRTSDNRVTVVKVLRNQHTNDSLLCYGYLICLGRPKYQKNMWYY